MPDAFSLFARLQDVGCSAVSDPQHIPMGPNQGGVLFFFYDPDGTLLEILQPPMQGS
jgi:catechol 2,3-dioxygenase-like lactoylglutathione lyase family enzyme